MRRNPILTIVIVFIIGVMFLQYLDDWSTARIAITKYRAGIIAKELDRYQLLHGHYPESLAELSSDLSIRIPNCVAGNEKWNYESEIWSFSYSLSFGRGDNNYPCYSYHHEEEKWYLDN